MKNFSNIVCIPDLLRNARGFPEGFFDILREPVRQGTGIEVEEIAWEARNSKRNGSFNFLKFLECSGIVGDAAPEGSWASNYYNFPSSAIDYLFNNLPQADGTIFLTFEIPPWLEQAFLQRGMDFIDLRLSPLRFSRDLYIALRTSNTEIFQRIGAHTVTPEEIRLEASLLGANLRMHQAHQEVKKSYRAENLESSLVFIGQTPNDASLLSSDNNFLRCSAFSDQLGALVKEKRFLYKIHPLAGDFFRDEISTLKEIIGQSPKICHLNTYQILSSQEKIELVGISSGVLQEAAWFNKIAHTLFQPYVPLLDFTEAINLKKYQQIHFQTFLSPAFWHQVLAPEIPAPRLAALPTLAHSHARETIDHWWDYSKVMTWERTLPYEAFMRSGGAALQQRVNQLEYAFEALKNDVLDMEKPLARAAISDRQNSIAHPNDSTSTASTPRPHCIAISTNLRNVENWLPLFHQIIRDGGTCEIIYLPWAGDPSTKDEHPPSLHINYQKKIESLDRNGLSEEELSEILDASITPQVDVAFICDMQSYPSSFVYEILSQREKKPLVIGLQHGLFQSWYLYNQNFCADYLFSFGERQKYELSKKLRNRVIPAGLPKLDTLASIVSKDNNYILFLSQNSINTTETSKLLEELEISFQLPVVTRSHPQYPKSTSRQSIFSPPMIHGVPADMLSLHEQIAHARWVLTSYSTAGLEALHIGKPVVLLPSHGITAWAGYPGIARAMNTTSILDALHRARKYHSEVKTFLEDVVGGRHFDHTRNAAQALYTLLSNKREENHE